MLRIKNRIGSAILKAAESFVIGISTTMQLLGQDKNTLAVVRLTDPNRY